MRALEAGGYIAVYNAKGKAGGYYGCPQGGTDLMDINGKLLKSNVDKDFNQLKSALVGIDWEFGMHQGTEYRLPHWHSKELDK